MRRFRGASKAPLAVAGILAAPLFFVALMAFSLRFDKPQGTTQALADPTKGTVGTIYLATFAVVAVILLVGALAMLLRSRLGVIVPSGVAIVLSILLLVPLGSWAAAHTDRYPLGIDNLPRSSSQDIWLRGEWGHNAKTTAHQIGFVTIAIAVAAILLSLLFEWRGRRAVVTGLPVEAVHAPDSTMPEL
jgi:hypothetical protein